MLTIWLLQFLLPGVAKSEQAASTHCLHHDTMGYHCVCVCLCLCLCNCAHICESQCCVSSTVALYLFEVGSLTAPGADCLARLCPLGPCESLVCLLALRLQACAVMPRVLPGHPSLHACPASTLASEHLPGLTGFP